MSDPNPAVPWGLRRTGRCTVCRKTFRFHPRLKERQRTCGDLKCRRTHRAKYQRKYRRANPELEKDYRQKVRSQRPWDYWRRYRVEHQRGRDRNRAVSALRRKLESVGLQRKLDIMQATDNTNKFREFVVFATIHRSLLDRCRATEAA